MKSITAFLGISLFSILNLRGEITPVVDVDKFGKELGGWSAKGGKAADYLMSDSKYRTFKPVITETPDGGRYISIRIDNVRGVFNSNDHALLQITIDGQAKLVAIESSIHTQGQSVKSDVVLTSAKQTAAVLNSNIVVSAGLSLAKDLSDKIIQQNKAEAGRVLFPSVIIHNYNKLCKSIRLENIKTEEEKKAEAPKTPPALDPNAPSAPPTPLPTKP